MTQAEVTTTLPEVVDLTGGAELDEASALYRRVFGYVDAQNALNPRLLLSMLRHGGIALGVRDEQQRLVAFAYGWTGLEQGRPFHYSQAVVVNEAWRSRGLGRRIKLAQRERALARGLSTMRWSFDPRRAANAYFNLDVLGAVGQEVVPDMFGPGEHRMVVAWDLTRPLRGPRPTTPTTPDPLPPPGEVARPAPGLRSLVLPAGRAEDPRVGDAVVGALVGLVQEGWSAFSCRPVDQARSVYLIRRGEDA